MRIFLKKGLCYLLILIVPQLQISGKSLERFLRLIREARMHTRTYKDEIIESVSNQLIRQKNGKSSTSTSVSCIFPAYDRGPAGDTA